MPAITSKEARVSPPLKIVEILHSKWSNAVLKSAVELDICGALADGAHTSDAVAKKLGLSSKGCLLLLNALVSMGFVIKNGEQYQLTDLSQAYLLKNSDLYIGKYILGMAQLEQSWAQLTDVVKTGKSVARVNEQSEAEKFFPELAAMIFPMNYSTAQMLADKLNISSMAGPVHVLDLAAGTGVWTLPMAQANPSVKVDALDFPAVLEVTKEYATKFGVEKQYEYLSGNWSDVALKQGHYDIIVLGHILHSEGKELSERMLKACFGALKPGGKLVVAEFLSHDDQVGPVGARLFALNMMIATDKGCVFTVTELKKMLEAAGLKNPERLELPVWREESPLMVAVK